MVEYATSRLLDEPLKAAIAELDRNVAEGRVAASRRVVGEQELDGQKPGRAGCNHAAGSRGDDDNRTEDGGPGGSEEGSLAPFFRLPLAAGHGR